MRSLDIKLALLMIIIVLILSGCSKNTVEINELRVQISEIQNQYANLRNDYQDLKRDSDRLNEIIIEQEKTNIETRERVEDFIEFYFDEPEYKSAWLSVYGDYFDTAGILVGELIFTIEEVIPYLDGYKLKLKIGNSTNVLLNGLDLKLNFAKNAFDLSDEQEVTINDTIYPGRWNSVEIIVNDVDKEYLVFMQVYANIKTVSFTNQL